MTDSLIQVVNSLWLVLRLVCPKKRLMLEVTTSRVERLGLVVPRQVLMHGLRLQVGREGSMRSRLLPRDRGNSFRDSNRVSNPRR